ncbi:arrestin domain-containing protein 3-like [Echeneis naucrates]|uniref:arrestin domain-containing protein 3-like n=1 Tax=Echeneis naucrates TaxID=173247 RepID=UPI0011146710|nr:arrestin domain-containing protein 3-like [Echeneis naucrates]
MTVKSIKVTCNPPAGRDAFTNGDWVSGQVDLELSKECHLNSLYVKFKGKAEVLWTERHGNTTAVYHAKDKYFSLRCYFIGENDSSGTDEQTAIIHNPETYNNVVAAGCHVYPFTFQFPLQDMPYSFKGSVGKIVYLLEARLSRSMRIDSTDSTKLKFFPRATAPTPAVMVPQHETKDKTLRFFNSGEVSMDVNIEKTGFFQGEGLKVVANIHNNSSREIKPKFCLYRKDSFFARGKRKLHTHDVLKEVGEPIQPSTKEIVTRVITIPHDVDPSILNCTILKTEYRLRVYLDVKYASDPEIKFPIIILPAAAPASAAAAAADFGFEAFRSPYPPAWGLPPPQQPPPASQSFESPPPYGAYQMYPPLSDFGNRF